MPFTTICIGYNLLKKQCLDFIILPLTIGIGSTLGFQRLRCLSVSPRMTMGKNETAVLKRALIKQVITCPKFFEKNNVYGPIKLIN